MSFKSIAPYELSENPFKLIDKDWMLITAEKDGKQNAMTASWGGLGIMWGKPVAYIVIRPDRYTKEFVESAEGFSLTFFGKEYRKMLSYMGAVSGRDEDKIAHEKLTITHDNNVPYFAEADIAIICRKLYAQDFKPECFIDNEPKDKWYPEKDWHKLYIAEIENILIKE